MLPFVKNSLWRVFIPNHRIKDKVMIKDAHISIGIFSAVERSSYTEIAFSLMCVGKINPIENIVK